MAIICIGLGVGCAISSPEFLIPPATLGISLLFPMLCKLVSGQPPYSIQNSGETSHRYIHIYNFYNSVLMVDFKADFVTESIVSPLKSTDKKTRYRG